MPALRHRTRLAFTPLEDRTVPSMVEAGFNDALGINADGTPNSPYTLGGNLNGTGASETGWTGPWVVGGGAQCVVDTSNVFEGDGSMYLGGGTVGSIRELSNGITAGKITVSQMIFVPPGGGVIQYLLDSGLAGADEGGSAQWSAIASKNFGIRSGGVDQYTGIPVPINQWVQVSAQVDMSARTWTF